MPPWTAPTTWGACTASARSAAIVEVDEPTFHERWEGRTFGLMITTGGLRAGGAAAEHRGDAAGRLPRGELLRAVGVLGRAGPRAGGTLTTGGDRRARRVTRSTCAPTADPERGAALVRALTIATEPARRRRRRALRGRAAGDRAADGPRAPPRCPRYVRGVTGTVDRRCTAGGRCPRRRRRARPRRSTPSRSRCADLWGDDAEPGTLFIDLWESYLE